MRCAVYCRLSQDRTGEELGVDRQRQDCRELITRRGGQVSAEFTDNSVSASSGRRRPAYEQLLDAVRRGEVDAIVAWSLDRLVRRMADLEQLVELCDRHRVMILLVRGSDLDLSTPGGRLVAGLLGTVARHEVEVKADRQRRANQQAAERGLPPGGRRAFGYDTTGAKQIRREAAAVKKAYADLLAGGTLSAIADTLNKAGHTTTMGGPWRHNAVRGMLTNPRNAGLRAHKGEVIGKATWRPIVGEDVYQAAVSLLADPGRRTNTRGNALTWLGTNLYFCGRCTTPQTMVATYRGSKARGDQRRVYRCSECYLTRAADPIDRFVELVVAKRLRRSDLADILASPVGDVDTGGLRTEAAALRFRINALADNIELSEALLARREKALRERLGKIEHQLAEAGRGSAAGALLGAKDPGQAWLDLDDLGRRQAVVRDLMTIRLLPAGPGRRVFDPATVDIT